MTLVTVASGLMRLCVYIYDEALYVCMFERELTEQHGVMQQGYYRC